MFPILLAVLFGVGLGVAKGRQKTGSVISGADTRAGMVWVPANQTTGVPGHWERARAGADPALQGQSAVAILMQLLNQNMPVSQGLAQAAWKEAIARGDTVTAQQIAVVFLRPQQPQFPPMMPPMMPPYPQQPPPIMVGEDVEASLREEYADMEPANPAPRNPPPQQAQPQSDPFQVSPDEWREFLLCFKTRDPSYRGERHIGAFEHATRRLGQLGLDPATLTTEESQYAALDKDLTSYRQNSEKLLNEFTGECVTVNGERVHVTRSGVLALLKAAGPVGAKGWLTDESQRKNFPGTTEIFVRGNGRF